MNVTFEEEQTLAAPVQSAPRTRGLYALMIRWGFAKDEKEATTALIVIAVAAILLTIGIWVFGGLRDTPPPEDILRTQPPQGV